ncbi:hypothetical protein GCM10010116_20580 [Microbispora rosea subsp. aerata]|nr:hypothetical protein GCM10010116_20580 [Microbispora rosea subsp. aerata]GLJ83008.1 hypothetical protein GCM10017588_17340 [Microbispora rosea subsp. aerata]
MIREGTRLPASIHVSVVDMHVSYAYEKAISIPNHLHDEGILHLGRGDSEGRRHAGVRYFE